MRIFFLLVFLYILYSCNNDLNTIGDTMIPAEGSIEVATYSITETSTVRLDSFPTSLNVNTSYGITSPYTKDAYQLTVGRIMDRTTGTTSATPYFQIFSDGYDSYLAGGDNAAVYDSLTLNLFTKENLPNVIAGDTTKIQIYKLYRLKDYPRLDMNNPVIYNNDSLPYDESGLLATLRIRPQKEYMNNNVLYFKLDNTLGRELFNQMKWQNPIFSPSRALDFIRYFKGLAIVPDKENTVLFPLDAPNLSLKCHYHSGSNSGSFSLPVFASHSYGSAYYAFTNIQHTPTEILENASWSTPVSFSNANMSVVQGLDGYAIRVKLPYIATNEVYKTILKVELELKPKLVNFENIPEPGTTIPLQMFRLDEYSRVTSILTDNSGNAVYANLYTNPNMPDDRKYKIDITDYYKNVVDSGNNPDPKLDFLIGLGGIPALIGVNEINTMVGYVSMSFDRLIITELPVLKIYYAKYK